MYSCCATLPIAEMNIVYVNTFLISTTGLTGELISWSCTTVFTYRSQQSLHCIIVEPYMYQICNINWWFCLLSISMMFMYWYTLLYIYKRYTNCVWTYGTMVQTALHWNIQSSLFGPFKLKHYDCSIKVADCSIRVYRFLSGKWSANFDWFNR